MKSLVALIFLLILTPEIQASCLVNQSNGSRVVKQGDTLFKILKEAPSCPRNVQELKELLSLAGLTTAPSMVANRGRHNPSQASFSFFEQVAGQNVKNGEFFFGHFTARQGLNIILDQAPSANKLLIELIVWDSEKLMFNFYELIGGKGWFYRGDSADALKDNTFLYRDPPAGSQKFGKTMRCSACHNSGGPIMKEIAFPHNDWAQSERPLPLGSNRPDAEVQDILNKTIDAHEFSEAVKTGNQLLQSSDKYRRMIFKLSPQERLRPLFCETEINLESDVNPFDERNSNIQVPSAFFVNPLLGNATLTTPQSIYRSFLSESRMKFPEINRTDADHAWLVPVKGFADLLAIEKLIEERFIDKEFAMDILSIDFENPVFSTKRCELLKLLPEKFTSNWKSEFMTKIKVEADTRKIMQYLDQVKADLKSSNSSKEHFQKMIDSRKAVFESEISKNPLGQILEPGFRVIFPEIQNRLRGR